MPTQVEELGGNRVRLTVDVAADDVKHAVDHAASDLAQSVKIPGFRAGKKVPMPVLVSRVGKERIYAEAVDSHIGGWYSLAVARTRLRPITRPDYDFTLPTTEESDWRFTATVEVQPLPEIVDWTTLEVPRIEAKVPEELIEQELEALRESVAELTPVERPAQPGDALVIDLSSPSGESQSDTVVVLGAGRLVEEIENELVGASAGDTRDVAYELADGSTATAHVAVKAVSEKVLPDVDDELARAASEFDTLAELRADIEGRLLAQIEAEVEDAFRAAAVDELVRASNVQGAGPLVETRTRELLNGFVRSLANRGISAEAYLAATGQSPEALTQRLRAEAGQSVARELALEALAERAGITVSDGEVDALIREQAEAAGDDADEVVADVWAHGHQETLREDLRLRAALDRLAADAKPISVEQAEAREKLWTPDKEKPQTETKLWTPGQRPSDAG